jgi:hypothetical protein
MNNFWTYKLPKSAQKIIHHSRMKPLPKITLDIRFHHNKNTPLLVKNIHLFPLLNHMFMLIKLIWNQSQHHGKTATKLQNFYAQNIAKYLWYNHTMNLQKYTLFDTLLCIQNTTFCPKNLIKNSGYFTPQTPLQNQNFITFKTMTHMPSKHLSYITKIYIYPPMEYLIFNFEWLDFLRVLDLVYSLHYLRE